MKPRLLAFVVLGLVLAGADLWMPREVLELSDAEGRQFGPLLVAAGLLILATAAGSQVRLHLPIAPQARLVPDPLTATEGTWRIDPEGGPFLRPGETTEIAVSFTSPRPVSASAVRLELVRIERWWVDYAYLGHRRREERDVVDATVLSGPTDLRARRRNRWSGFVTVPFDAPPTVRAPRASHAIACSWHLEVVVDAGDAGGIRATQPVIVNQPSARLRAGSMRGGQFARHDGVMDHVAGVFGTLESSPAPLDLAKPARLRVTLAPRVDPGTIGSIVVELEARLTSKTTEREVLWLASVPAARLTRDGATLSFDIPPINALTPDADLRNGRVRSHLRVRLVRDWRPDIVIERDLALCLEGPRTPRDGAGERIAGPSSPPDAGGSGPPSSGGPTT